MSKPICVIYLPYSLDGGNGRMLTPVDLMSALNGRDDSKHKPDDYWKDYLWFSFYKDDIIAPEFQVFHEKDFTEIQYEELKELLEKSLTELSKIKA